MSKLRPIGGANPKSEVESPGLAAMRGFLKQDDKQLAAARQDSGKHLHRLAKDHPHVRTLVDKGQLPTGPRSAPIHIATGQPVKKAWGGK